ncbi:MAG: hypothetical protein CMI02_11310 [Oceanospirillaceae bacterium]|nr:hypothetical protein [Oceanospirillaceae bacterium]MBT12607.1 hypothetical protein [Oceanospirillaceae bacterium]|tara:strand:- start:84290 stop:85063 length:774 start_codon:yes stop_codon:yes gene_type:complete
MMLTKRITRLLLLCSILPLTAFAAEETATSTSTATSRPASLQAADNNTMTLKPFTAHYTTEWKVGWFSIDIDASRTLRQLSNGHWQLVFEADASAAGLTETSEFRVEDGQIYPLEYRYRATGLFNEDDRTLVFAPELRRVTDLEKQKEYQDAWDEHVQDNLTYMLQAGLDLSAGAKELTYDVFEKNRAKDFHFRVVAEEQLNTRIGKLKTLKVQQIRKDKDRSIYAWYAIDHQYQLVRLVDRKDGKKRYQIDITDLK